MNIYKLLKLNRSIKNHRIKFFALFLLHKFNKRYLSVNIDPILACNLRCKMCYFSDNDYVKSLKGKGQFKKEEIERVAKTIFSRALKLQIGCGTEPTVYKNLSDVVALGKKYKVPYISITTNANLLDEEKIEELLKAGLNEFTISLHGVNKESYENFMKKGNYEKFKNAFRAFEKLKAKYDFKVRINYTFNKDNFLELKDFFKQFNGKSFDILQIRPIRKIGNSEYNDFDLEPIQENYYSIIQEIKRNCKENSITLLASDVLLKKDLVDDTSFIANYTYCYVSPEKFWKEGFNWKEESFEEFSRRIGWSKRLFLNVFMSKDKLQSTPNHLNYDIKI
ncbi:radical SAM protein [Thalassobellus suaedae]|uniref:Radical SAM protein n=1 Tax=Thalassobellus suaedae TaxID=3074124 RepID=A0ABY9XRH8_9FLAO|nr:radical SAM protein [Flavobacteriaceae bacterium HL-DH14]